MPSTALEILDGRQSRTARSRLAICEACLDLVQEGELQPSADQVAERAGLSRRSIFNHFADLAELYDAVVEAGMQRCAPLRVEIPREGPVERRVEQLVQARATFLEATAAFLRALTAQTLVGPAAEQALGVMKNGARLQHQEVERLFAGDLSRLSAADRTEALEAISTAMSPPQWEHLRRRRGQSASRARAVMQRTVTAILRDAGVDV